MRLSGIKKYILVLLACIMACLGSFDAFAEVILSKEEIASTAGKTLGVQTGSIYVERVKDYFPDANIVYFSSMVDMTTAVVQGKADGFVEDSSIIDYCASMNPGMKSETIADDVTYTAVIAPKTDKGELLVNQFNEALQKMKDNGEYYRIYDKWFNKNGDDVSVDYEKLPDINGTITIASEPGTPPFNVVVGGVTSGFETELVGEFCKEYGYRPKFMSVSFDGIIAGLTSGKYDMGASAFTITDERKKSVLFTDPIIENYPTIAYMDMEFGGGTASFIDSIKNSFYKTFIQDSRWKLFVKGITVTLCITIVSILAGSILGFAVHLLCRKGGRIPNAISDFCRWLVKGMPEVVFLMILFYIVFGNSAIGGMWVAIIGFTIIFTCFIHEMLQAGELAIDRGQYLAAEALGYSGTQSFFLIIFPQTAKHCIPSFTSQITAHIKATAIVGYIAVVDLTKVGDLIRGMTYDPFFPLIAVAILYFILAGILKLIVKLLTKKLDFESRSEEEVLKGLVIE